jgi:V/A-type H+-transporting ATPase subunit I
MIVAMKKVSILIMDKMQDTSLEKLRELGVVHLERKTVSSDSLSKLLEQKNRAENALGILRTYKIDKKTKIKSAKLEKITERVLTLADRRKSLQEQLVFNAKERSRIEKWGDFDPDALKDLAEIGIVLIPYELSNKVYADLTDDQQLIVLGKDKKAVYGLAVGKEIEGEIAFVIPELSLSGLDKKTVSIGKELSDIEGQLLSLTSGKTEIETELASLKEKIEFESARAGLENADLGDVTVSWMTGFVPQETVQTLKRAASENGWALVIDDPGLDDATPTLLKNNRLVSLIYPLTGFLEVVPGYNEVDISGWFLLFFCIFFGMIFGDAGYGLLLALIGIIGIAKTAQKGIPAVLKMLVLLSISNIIWGVLTCTWFGIDVSLLPSVLRSISLPLISGAVAAQSEQAKAIVDQNLQIFCFSLALLQLGIAHIKGIIKNIKSLKLFGELGSLAMLIGIYNLILFLVVSNSYRQIPFLPQSLYFIIGGFALTFVFASYEGNIGQSILSSLKNIISVVLGVTNVFSDIMSYIRLWAVGLAGASISATVNSMAGPLLGNFLIFLGIILLVFGHGLNIILNVLSVLVHGVRLNTLEFSGHLGLTWSGIAYKPFSKMEKV